MSYIRKVTIEVIMEVPDEGTYDYESYLNDVRRNMWGAKDYLTHKTDEVGEIAVAMVHDSIIRHSSCTANALEIRRDVRVEGREARADQLRATDVIYVNGHGVVHVMHVAQRTKSPYAPHEDVTLLVLDPKTNDVHSWDYPSDEMFTVLN